ncbi:MAG TPA: GAF domain-containing protein [Thermoanaerobaculia bacterium]|nr:GAF domain-containing protein [Thermoanaerobaculia bacterium]
MLAGLDSETVEACLRLLGEELRFLVADSSEEALRLLAAHPVAVLAVGAGISGERALRLIEEADALPEGERRVNLVLAGGPDPSLFQDLIDHDRVFYLSQEPVPAGDLIALLRGATARWRSTAPRGDEEERRRAAFARQLFAATQAVLSQRQPPGVARAAAESVEDMVRADRGYCLLYDRATDTLWEPPRDADLEEERRETAAVGLVSFVLRTGSPVVLDRLGTDPRFDRDADDPKARGDERFLAVPVPSPDGRVLAVLAAVRAGDERPFSEEDRQALSLLAEQAAPAFAQLGLTEGNEGLPAAALFREEAVEYHQGGLRSEGDVLRVDPGWMRWTYRLLVTALVAGLLFSLLAHVREYASGPAVVRLGGRSDLTATADGTVSQIAVAPGQRVEPGRLLVRFYGVREAAELARIDHEFELQLINRLRDPGDAGAEQALISLRAQRELARSNLAEREVRAPAAGVVSDLRVRVGQRIMPGQTLLSLSRGGSSRPEVVALLPGEYRPLLKRGMPLRLELQGYRYAYQHLVVDSVGDEVVGPNEARRSLGDEVADAVQLTGPVVRVSGHLDSDTFEAEGKVRRYHDGMWGKAEVRVRSEPVLVALVPALKAVFEPREGGDA